MLHLVYFSILTLTWSQYIGNKQFGFKKSVFGAKLVPNGHQNREKYFSKAFLMSFPQTLTPEIQNDTFEDLIYTIVIIWLQIFILTHVTVESYFSTI